jgi:histone acetyltransferase 1
MQLFVLLYIEAGSYIDEEEDIWEFVVLYVVNSGAPHYLTLIEPDLKSVNGEQHHM